MNSMTDARRLLVAVSFFGMCSCSAYAQVQAAVSTNQPVALGDAVSVIVTGTGDSVESWCGFRIEFGDGNGADVKVERSLPFPKRFEHVYAKEGNYTVTIVGKRVTTHIPCPINLQAAVRVNSQVATAAGRVTPAKPAVVPAAGTGRDASASNPNCPQQVMVKSAAGQDVAFNLREMIKEAGGASNALEQISRRIIEAQSKALDDAIDATERNTAKSFAASLMLLRNQLTANCSN